MQDKKKNVLFVVHQLNHGGVQHSLIDALNGIDYNSNEVTLYIRKKRIQLLYEVNSHVNVIVNEDNTNYYRKFPVLIFTILSRICKLFKAQRWIEKLSVREDRYVIKKQYKNEKKRWFSNGKRFDMAVSYFYGYTAEFVSTMIDADKKIMFYFSSTDDYHALHESIMPYFNRIVSDSVLSAENIQRNYPFISSRVNLIPNLIKADVIRRKAASEMILVPNRDLCLTTCGRMTKVKGYDLAVEAAAIIKRKGISFNWYFIGDGHERDSLEKLIECYGLEDNITITGIQDNPFPYIDACDIYVQPSYEESFGLTISEAKVLCKPVVSTRTIGGIQQIVDEKNGLLCDINGQSIADAILHLLDQPMLKENIVKSLHEVDYSVEEKRYKEEWKELLSI